MKTRIIVSLIGLIFSTSSLADTLPGSNSTVIAQTGNTTTILSTSNTAILPASGSANTALIGSSNTATLPTTSSNTNPLLKSNAQAPSSLTQFCPTIDQLVKDPQKLTWSAPGGWQSYQQSFAIQIGTFTGVQWAGIKLGQVICTYAAVEKDSFPIQLVYNKLVFQPSGGAWGQNMGGYINCKSTHVNDCPFPVKLTQVTDVIKEAEAIKPTVPQEQAF